MVLNKDSLLEIVVHQYVLFIKLLLYTGYFTYFFSIF